MEHIAAIINALSAILGSVAWPIVILIIFFKLKEPICNIFPSLKRLKYKDLEVIFGESLKKATDNEEIKKIDYKPTREDQEQILRLAELSPDSAILMAWKEIENEAQAKIDELMTKENSRLVSNANPLNQLMSLDVLDPELVNVAWELRQLRNEVAHTNKAQISKEKVLEYATLAKTIIKRIREITSIPKQRLIILTMIIAELAHLIDTNKYNDITIEDIHKHIELKDIISFLQDIAKEDADFSLLLKSSYYQVYLDNYYEAILNLYDAYAGDESRKWGIQNSGLCLLLTWTNELISKGSGWKSIVD